MNYKNLLKIFLIMAVVVVGMTCVSAGLFGDSDALLGDGEYKVGDDLPAGEYYVKCDGNNLYVEVSSDSSGNLDSIIYNLNTKGGVYVTVEDGEYLEINGGDLYELDKSPDRGAEDGYYKEGQYKVGEDIPAGEYKVEATDDISAYIEVSSDSRHQIEGIVTNDNFDGNKYVTVEDGQYLTLSNGAQIKA